MPGQTCCAWPSASGSASSTGSVAVGGDRVGERTVEDPAARRHHHRSPHGLEQVSGTEYDAGDVSLMGADAIHSIENPLGTNNAALHVFAGNPFTAACSQWDPDTLHEAPFDIAYVMSVYPSPNP